MAEYIKKSDVIKSMENNSHMMEVFGVQRKMIDGIMLCYDIADMKTIDYEEEDAEMKGE